jgi:hypothetical protein
VANAVELEAEETTWLGVSDMAEEEVVAIVEMDEKSNLWFLVSVHRVRKAKRKYNGLLIYTVTVKS